MVIINPNMKQYDRLFAQLRAGIAQLEFPNNEPLANDEVIDSVTIL